jgi:hypothetical protein
MSREISVFRADSAFNGRKEVGHLESFGGAIAMANGTGAGAQTDLSLGLHTKPVLNTLDGRDSLNARCSWPHR